VVRIVARILYKNRKSWRSWISKAFFIV